MPKIALLIAGAALLAGTRVEATDKCDSRREAIAELERAADEMQGQVKLQDDARLRYSREFDDWSRERAWDKTRRQAAQNSVLQSKAYIDSQIEAAPYEKQLRAWRDLASALHRGDATPQEVCRHATDAVEATRRLMNIRAKQYELASEMLKAEQ